MLSKSRTVFCVLLLVNLALSANAIRLTDLSVSDDVVDYGDEFDVTAKFSGDITNYQAWYYVNNYRFKRLNIVDDELSAEFGDSDADWDHVTCGPATAHVEVYNSAATLLMLNESVDFNIGSVPVLEFTPSRPKPDQNVRVKLKDPDSGQPLKNVDVEIKDVYGGDPVSKRTDSSGTFTFTPKVAGEYVMTVEERDYCGNIVFYIKRPMLVDGPHPENPVVNEMIQIAVPAGSSVGIKVINEQGDIYTTVPVSYNGGANFTISDPGNYSLVIGDLSTKYWSHNASLYVSQRPTPRLEIAPEKPVVGKPMTFTVTSRGDPLPNAVVTVTKPDGVAREYTSSSYGIVNYDSVTETGEYKLVASKERYADTQASFEAYNAFEPILEPALPTVQDTITLTVNDQNGNPVSDALVEVPGIDFMRVCDMGGRVSFGLQQPQEYEIRITKPLYWNETVKVTPYGLLDLSVSEKEFELGGSVTFDIVDSFGEPAPAEIRVADPDGVVRYYSGATFTLNPEKPGEHLVTAEQTNYLSDNETFTVLPHPLDVSSYMSAGKLYVNVTYEGSPVSGIALSLDAGDAIVNATTNTQGMASFKVSEEGSVSLTVNPGKTVKVYGEKTVPLNVVRSYDLVLLTTPLVLIFLITLFAIVAIQLGRMYLGKQWSPDTKTKPKKKPQRKGKSRHDSSLLGRREGGGGLSGI